MNRTIIQNNTDLTETEIWKKYYAFQDFFADAFPRWRTEIGEDVFVVENGELIGSIRKYGDTSNQIVIVTDND
jgi:hypothetical protein